MKRSLLSMITIALIAGCASQAKKEEPKAVVEERAPTPAAPPKTTEAPKPTPVQPSITRVDPLKDPNNILSKRSVFYGFDSSSVEPEYKPMIEAHSKYLLQNNATKVTIQGNTDERGSREYNLALGQRRADAVRKIMNVLGVPDKQIETTSFGKEKPRATGHDEASWAQNRRADIVYPGE